MTIIGGTVRAEDIGGNRRRLITPYCCIIDDTLYVVPKGYEWNGASLPRFAWSLHGHPYDDIHREPSLWHDAAHDGLFERQGVTREYSNKVYAHWVHANGLSAIKSIVEYLAVKFFGASHWYADKTTKRKTK